MKKTTSSDRRFTGKAGNEYEKLLRALPYLTDIQRGIGELAGQTWDSDDGFASILELGCGTGMTSRELAASFSRAYITAIDNEPAMLRQYKAWLKTGHKRFANAGDVTIEVKKADALEALNWYAPKQCDVVVSGFMLHNLEKTKRTQIVNEIFRVLRPGGRFVNGDKIATNDKIDHNLSFVETIRAFCDSFPDDNAYAIEWIEHYVRDNHPDLRYTEREVFATLRKAGFKNITITERHGLDAIVFADKPK